MFYADRLLAAVVAVQAMLFTSSACATKPPADPCSLLPAVEVSKVVGGEYGAPQSSTAPRPYRNTAEGTDCAYRGKSGHGTLLFRIYFDASPAESAQLFDKLRMFYGTPIPLPGVGDDAYLDSKHALHERKGNVRFFLELSGVDVQPATKEKHLIDLAGGVSRRL